MFGGLRRREHAVADQAFAFTADNNKNFATISICVCLIERCSLR
jgi:hypothetical protein